MMAEVIMCESFCACSKGDLSVCWQRLLYVNPFVRGESVSVMAEVIICESFCACSKGNLSA